MSYVVRVIVSLVVVAAILAGCRPESKTVRDGRTGPAAAAPSADNGPAAGSLRPDDADTVLLIGRSRYTRSDFRRFYEKYATDNTAREKVFERFVNDRLLAEEVTNGGYDKVAWVRQEKSAMTNNVLANRFIGTKLTASLKPTDAEMKKQLPPDWDQVKLQVVVFLDDGPKTAEVVRTAKEGADFSAIVAQHSHVQNEREGMTDYLFRDTDYFSKKDVERIFKLEKGAVSDLIQGPIGFYLVKVVDKRTLPREQQRHVLENTRDKIYAEKLKAVYEGYLEKARYKVLEENLAKAARASVSAGRAMLPELPVLKIGAEEYPFRIIARMAGPKVFDVQKDPAMVVEILKDKCREFVLIDRIAADARSFATKILPEEQAQIDREVFLFGVNAMLAEKIPSDNAAARYGEYLKDLRRKYRVERNDALVASMELPKAKSHPPMH